MAGIKGSESRRRTGIGISCEQGKFTPYTAIFIKLIGSPWQALAQPDRPFFRLQDGNAQFLLLVFTQPGASPVL